MKKTEKLDKLLKSGRWVHADLVREKCAMAQSGFHKALFNWRKANPEYSVIKKKVETANSYFLKYKAVKV